MTDNFSPLKIKRYLASQDLTLKSGHAVRLNADRKIQLAETDSEMMGVLDNRPNLNEPAVVVVYGFTVGKLSESVIAGATLSVETDGTLRNNVEPEKVIGFATQAGNAGDYVEIFVDTRGAAGVGTAVSSLETEVNNIETSTGLNADGTLPPFAGTNLIDGSASIKVAVEELDSYLGNIDTLTGEVRTNYPLLSGSTVEANLKQLDSAIGKNSDFTEWLRTYNALNIDNSINDNLDRLDGAIGPDSHLTPEARTFSPVTINSSVYTKIDELDRAIGDVSTDVWLWKPYLATRTRVWDGQSWGNNLRVLARSISGDGTSEFSLGDWSFGIARSVSSGSYASDSPIITRIARLDVAIGGDSDIGTLSSRTFEGLSTYQRTWGMIGGLDRAIGNNPTSTNYISISNAVNANLSALDSALNTVDSQQTLSDLTPTDNAIVIGNGTTFITESGATARASLGLAIGTNVQAWDTNLDQLAALATTDDNFIVGTGSAWEIQSPSSVRTTLGLVEGGVGDIWVLRDGDNMTGPLNMGTYKVTTSYNPVDDVDLVNKGYVDGLVTGLDWKDSVKGTTTLSIGGTYNPTGGTGGSGAFTNVDLTSDSIFDGVPTLSAYQIDDRILVKNQSDAKQNGIYIVTTAGATGALERSHDQDGTPANEVSSGNTTYVENGTTFGASAWRVSGNGILTLNTDNINWFQTSGAGQVIAGTGLTKSGNTLSVLLGAGIADLPTGEVGVDLYNSSTGAIILTGDGSTRSTLTGAKLHLLLDTGSSGILTQGANGLKVANAGITEDEIASSSLGNGLTGGSGTVLSVNNDTVGSGGTLGTLSFNAGKLAVDLGTASNVAAAGNHTHTLNDLSDVVVTANENDFLMYSGGNWVDRTPAQVKATLDLEIGTDVQAWDANLDQIAALTPADGNFIVGDGTAWVAESGATARTSLGLVAGGAGDIWVEKAGDTMTGDLTVEGNTTFGNAISDTTTINSIVGIGGAPFSSVGVYVQSAPTSGTVRYGLASEPTALSGTTSQINALWSKARTEAASFTVGNAAGLRIADAAKGAGSTISILNGVVIEDLTQGNINYGIRSQISSGTDKWNLYLDGTASNYIAGNVGIGGTPSTRLDVVAPDNTNGFTLRQNSTYNAGTEFALKITENTGVTLDCSDGVVTPRAFIFTSGGSEKMRISSAGTIGVGVTPSSWVSTFKAIQLGQGASVYSNDTTSGTLLGANVYYDGVNNRYINTASSSAYFLDGNSHKWFIAPSGTAGNNITFTQAMTLDAQGDLGLGTTNPTTYESSFIGSGHRFLNVENTGGNYSVIGAAASQSTTNQRIGLLAFANTNNSAGYKYSAWVLAESEGTTANQLGGRLAFATMSDASTAGPIERMRIDNAGKVIINGTTAYDNSYLNVTTPTGQNKIAAFDGGGVGARARFFISASALNTIDLVTDQVGSVLRFVQNATEVARFDASGNMGIGGTSAGGRLHVTVPTAGNTSLSLQRSTSSRFDFVSGITAVTGDSLSIRDATLSREYLMLRDSNVGVGTISPTAKVHLEASSNPELKMTFTGQRTYALRVTGGTTTDGLAVRDDSGSNEIARFARDGNVSIQTVGAGLKVKEGSNAKMGVATLVGGTVTVNTTAVSATSRIFLTGQNSSGTHGELTVSARTAATSFTITSSSGTDTRDVAWIIFDPA